MSQSFLSVATRWKAEKRQWVKPSSYASYVRIVNAHLLPHFGRGGRPGEAAIQAFVNAELGRGLSRKTVQDALVVLKMILRYGEKAGAWPHRDFEVHFPATAVPGRGVQVLTRSEQRQLAAFLRAYPTRRNVGILLCLHSGLRIGEVCALQWRDVDLAAGVIRVRRTVQRIWLQDGAERVNALVSGSPKTVASRREIPLSAELLRLLRPLRRSAEPSQFLVSGRETPMEPRYYRDYLKRTLARLGLPPLRFHALRHSFATRCIESRCDYKAVSAILGHSSISTTLDLYVHPDLAAKKRAIERMLRG